MQCKFEELGVSIDGHNYGLFSGEAELFDRAGQAVIITVEPLSEKTYADDIRDYIPEGHLPFRRGLRMASSPRQRKMLSLDPDVLRAAYEYSRDSGERLDDIYDRALRD